MSEDFPPSNPFRRRPRTDEELQDEHQLRVQQELPQRPPPLDVWSASAEEAPKLQTKPVKKVRVLSPPASSPEVDSTSFPSPFPLGEGKDQFLDDPFGITLPEASEALDGDIASQSRQRAPANPFQKTLATLEHTEGIVTGAPGQAGPGNGRASLDVESFKRLLMTGSATDTSPVTAPPNPIRAAHVGVQDGTSTEASSVSKQSIFEPIQETHPESPRTSHEVSDPDEEARRVSADGLSLSSDRKKPPPPSSRHGKLIKVELKEEAPSTLKDTPSITNSTTPLSSPGHTQTQTEASPTDLNKPLPPAPIRASHDSDRESIFDREAAGKTPEPPSPSASVRRKTPPAPPLTRRHTQLASETRSSKQLAAKPPPKAEDDSSIVSIPDYPLSTPITASPPPPAVSTSSTASPPPPPPPRRPAATRNPPTQSSISGISLTDLERSTSASGTPALPLSRVQSVRQPSRPQSVTGVEATSKRVSVGPPPPPPPRQRASSRNSMDAPVLSPGSSRTSGEYFRSQYQQPRGARVGSSSSQGTVDILADITALQKEVDALRGQFERKSIS